MALSLPALGNTKSMRLSFALASIFVTTAAFAIVTSSKNIPQRTHKAAIADLVSRPRMPYREALQSQIKRDGRVLPQVHCDGAVEVRCVVALEPVRVDPGQ